MKKKVFTIIICSIVLIAFGCQNKSQQFYKEFTEDSDNSIKDVSDDRSTVGLYDDVQNKNENVTGELTIYVRNVHTNIFDDWLIDEFNKEYPNVHVTVTGPDTIDEYTTKASVALMSGEAGDIISLFTLPYSLYVKNDLLEDLYPYMEQDPTFKMEDYYANIFKGLEYNDKLYCMPLGFSYWCYRFNKNLLEENNIEISRFNTVNYKNLSDIYQQILLNKEDLILSKMMIPYDIEINEYVSYLDEMNNTTNFNSTDFIDYLNKMKSISWPEYIPITRYSADYLISLESNELCSHFFSLYNDPRNASVYDTLKMTAPIPESASNGDKPYQTVGTPLGITSSSKNKELAWLFIRFCSKERNIENMDLGNNYFMDGYPINRKNTIKQLEKAFGPGHEEEIAIIDSWNADRNCTNMISDKDELLFILGEISNEFYAGRMTAEECAVQIQERVDIFLKE